MVIRSAQFDDIYFSAEDGLAETRYVFLEGNSLPQAWQGRERFVIAETGFGTGLNFLAAWALFERTARPEQKLHYISFEKYPLAWGDISRALSVWQDEFRGRMDRLRQLYPLRVPGFHRVMINHQVTLTLVFDDVNEALPQLDVPGGVNAWFLDGFAPAKNPDMWTEKVFEQIGRLSASEATFATFTAAGAVRRGLEAVGFGVEKREGYGRKREMLVGHFQKKQYDNPIIKTKRIAVIGGGLAGCSAAFVLRRYGYDPVVFDAAGQIADGASGNDLGLYNPRLSKLRGTDSDFYTAGWAQVYRTLKDIQRTGNIGFESCGSLHLFVNEEKAERFQSTVEHWGWHDDHMHLLDARQASQRAGVKLNMPALCLPEAGIVSPVKLCEAYVEGVDVRLGVSVDALEKTETGWRVNGENFDAVVLACAVGAKNLDSLDWLPLHTVRGQITKIESLSSLHGLQMNLCYGGYCSPRLDGHHYMGATFQRGDNDNGVRSDDDNENIGQLAAIVSGLQDVEVKGHRAGQRTSSQDRFPLIGRVPDRTSWEKDGGTFPDGLYISAGHGSHGIVSSLAGAHLIADMIAENPVSLSRDTVKALCPSRFLERMKRRGESSGFMSCPRRRASGNKKEESDS